MLEEMRKIDECDMEKLGTRDDRYPNRRWWPQTAKHKGDKTSQTFLSRWKKRNKRLNV